MGPMPGVTYDPYAHLDRPTTLKWASVVRDRTEDDYTTAPGVRGGG